MQLQANRVAERVYGDGECGLKCQVFNRQLSASEIAEVSEDYYCGPGQPFARTSVRQTKRRTAVYTRWGLDI